MQTRAEGDEDLVSGGVDGDEWWWDGRCVAHGVTLNDSALSDALELALKRG